MKKALLLCLFSAGSMMAADIGYTFQNKTQRQLYIKVDYDDTAACGWLGSGKHDEKYLEPQNRGNPGEATFDPHCCVRFFQIYTASWDAHGNPQAGQWLYSKHVDFCGSKNIRINYKNPNNPKSQDIEVDW